MPPFLGTTWTKDHFSIRRRGQGSREVGGFVREEALLTGLAHGWQAKVEECLLDAVVESPDLEDATRVGGGGHLASQLPGDPERSKTSSFFLPGNL
jgi:hypothetical protein